MFKAFKKKFNVHIFPDDTQPMKDFSISYWFAYLLGGFAFVIFVVVLFTIFSYSWFFNKMQDYYNLEQANDRLYKENEEYKKILMDLDSIFIIKSKLENIAQVYFNKKIDLKKYSPQSKLPELVSEQQINKYVKRVGKKMAADSNIINEVPNINPVSGYLSQTFKANQKDKHNGVDIAAMLNDPVVATAPGLVVFRGKQDDLGNTIIIKHNETFKTVYAHLNRTMVQRGDWVKRGETIGVVGMTGKTSGPHLHYEVLKDGTQVDPKKYFPN